MQNIVLVVHLILALCLIAVVLLQRSEGGALGMGGGGGGLVSSRGAATALSKMTWVLAVGFLCTSLLLTVLAGGGQPGSVIERVLGVAPPAAAPLPGGIDTQDVLVLPPPAPAAPLTPPAAD